MSRSLMARRALTVGGVIVVVAVGFGAIRVAAAWTASSAPLAVSPVPAAELQARLADEQARSTSLTEQLTGLTSRIEDLTAALDQAQARIDADRDHAGDLALRLTAAKRRLAKLEAAIATRGAGGVTTVRTSSPARSGTGGHEAEHEAEHEVD